MAATVINNWMGRPPRLIEQNGVVVGMDTTTLVHDLTSNDVDIVEEALSLSTVPQPGDIPDDYQNLILTARDCEVMGGGNNRKLLIACRYESRADAGREFIFRGGMSVIQERRRVDYYGFPLYTAYNDGSGLQYQGGEIDTVIPQSTIQASGILSTDFPLRESHLWGARLNDRPWGDASRGVWMCTRVDWYPIDVKASPKKYKFLYEFQANLRGWQPQIWYIDPATGLPQYGAVAGVGYKTVFIYPYRDFNTRFEF